MEFLGSHCKTGLFLFFFYLKVKVGVKVWNLNIFGGCKISNTFLGMHDISRMLF